MHLHLQLVQPTQHAWPHGNEHGLKKHMESAGPQQLRGQVVRAGEADADLANVRPSNLLNMHSQTQHPSYTLGSFLNSMQQACRGECLTAGLLSSTLMEKAVGPRLVSGPTDLTTVA